MPKLSNVTIEMISLVKNGANRQRLQFCKSADNDSDIICYECSKIRKDDNGGPSPEMIKEIDSIICGQDSACYELCGLANMHMNLTPDMDVKQQYREQVWTEMKNRPDLYERHVRTILSDALPK